MWESLVRALILWFLGDQVWSPAASRVQIKRKKEGSRAGKPPGKIVGPEVFSPLTKALGVSRRRSQVEPRA